MRTTITTLAIAFAAATAAPAFAASNSCDVAPAQLRAAAAKADANVASQAERNIRLGEALCEARNRAEGERKFKLAAKTLGVDYATVLAGAEAATPAQ